MNESSDTVELQIIPGILEQEWDEIEKKLEIVKPFAKTIHVDLLDGVFAHNTTFTFPEPFKNYSKDLFLEVHMMVDDPLRYVESFAAAGFRRFIGHVEKMPDQVAFVAMAERYGDVGLALDGPTPLDAIKVSYEDLDVVMIYTSEKVGFSGPPFLVERLEKVRKIREQHAFIPIEVDGGINDKTILEAKSAGATRFISTSFLFKSEDPKKQYELLQKALEI